MADPSPKSHQLPCSNFNQVKDGQPFPCPNLGSKACNGCFLVQYCCKECQVADWNTHKKDCKSPLMKSSWRPQWDIEKRKPAFIDGSGGSSFLDSDGDSLMGNWISMVQHGRKKYLWGNVPAIDILQSRQNEGNTLPEMFNLLFAASGDIRNLVKSLAGLPIAFTGRCEVTINDKDFDIVARNAILLLAALVFDPIEAAEIIIHIWYSAFITESTLYRLQELVLPLIEDVCLKIRGRAQQSLHSKTWEFGSRKLRLVLPKTLWDSLPAFLKVPDGLSTGQAQRLMVETTLPPSRRDYVDRAFYTRPPAWRVCATKFRTDGMLLPFGQSREKFTIPNPTLFQSSDFWPMMDSADPLEGWSFEEFLSSPSPARNDIYGSLYFYLQEQFRTFCQRLGNLQVHFQLFKLDAIDLPRVLKGRGVGERYFDRIEVSNIGDRGYIGPEMLLATFAPYLKRKLQNSHATLLALFINAAHENSTIQDYMSDSTTEVQKLKRYLPLRSELFSRRENAQYNAELLRFNDARSMVRDFDRPFDKFMKECHLAEISQMLGVKIKNKHTLVARWPLRLRKGAKQEEFDMIMASGHTGSERYVEWESLG